MWVIEILWNMLTKPGRGKRVFVGVSGGVDSSVSALVLKLYGYDVTGVFIRTWQPDWIECTWRDERRDAMRVCAHLEIPFIELDLEREYKEGVADYMIAEYRAGRTPNPDVMCNHEVKFGGFLNWSLGQGANFVATGHYAQTTSPQPSPTLGEGAPQLVKGVDHSKDQSYFLWTLTTDQLSKILFPVGHLQKFQVRNIAKWFRIPIASKKDSQGICFIGDIDMKEFLSHYIEKKEGNVLDQNGEIIGTHDGVLLYTLGERHGFIINKKTPNDAPYYIIAKDIKNNILTVSHDIQSKHHSHNVEIINCVWRSEIEHKSYTAQIRYHGELVGCTITGLNKDRATVIFKHTDPTISSGQSVVVYDNEICIGGGIVL